MPETMPPPPAGYEDAAPSVKTRASAVPPPPDGYEYVPDSAQLGGAIGDFMGGNARVVSDTYKAEQQAQAEKPVGPLSPINYAREVVRRANPDFTPDQVNHAAHALRLNQLTGSQMKANSPEPERNILQKVIAGTGKALTYPQAPVKAALYNLQQMSGLDKPVLQGDVEEQKKLAAMNFLQKMVELKDQPLRNLGRPETEIYSQKRYQNEPVVGKVMDYAGQALGDVATNPLTYVTGGLGKTAHLGMGSAMAAGQLAPLIENPGMFRDDPVRATMDLALAALGAYGLREAVKRGSVPEPQPEAASKNRVKTVEPGKTKGGTKIVNTPQMSEATGPAVSEQPQNIKPVQSEPAPPATKPRVRVKSAFTPVEDAAPTTPAAVAPEAPAVTGVKAEPRASESVPAKSAVPDGYAKNVTLTVDGRERTVSLTKEQADKWDAAEKSFNQRKAMIARQFTGVEYSQQMKSAAMQYAAEKRQITGHLSDKEIINEQKRQASNYTGKPVTIDGQSGKVVGNSFGKVRVQFEDGTVRSILPEDVQGHEFKPPAKAPEYVAPKAALVSEVKPTEPVKVAEPAKPVPAQEVNPVESKTTGIAQRVHDVRAEAGKIGEIKPGEGVSAKEMVERGRELVKQGVNPEEHLASMEKRGSAVSGDDIAVLRAKYEELGKATDRASDARRANPGNPELDKAYQDAKKAETDWAKRIKPYQTEWHKIGQAQQGETDLDTGSFTSIDREFTKRANRNMKPHEEVQATQHAESVKGYEARISELQKQIDEALKVTAEKKAAAPVKSVRVKSVPSDPAMLREHFAKRIADNSLFASKTMSNKEAGAIPKSAMPNFTTAEVKAIWDHAKKNYIDKGAEYHDTVSGVARDLGLKTEWVHDAFTKNKSIRTLTDEMYRVQSYRRNAVANARAFVESAGKPGYVKVLRAATNFPRGLAVFGHGAVGMITHAGKNIARPSSWSVYWPNFIRQFKFVARADIHEAAMQTLERSPNFVEKMRAGLKVDPNRIYDDYQLYGKFIGNVGRAGNRGMDALKVFRSEYYDHVMGKLPEELRKDPEMQKAVADWVNGASGSGSIGHGPIADVVHEGMFASSLEASRWKALIGDPVKTAKTFANWSNATPAEKAIAIHRVKTAAEIVAVYLGALGANKALQSTTGQKDQVNLTDPTQSDFLKFKWNGRTLDFTGNATAPIRFLARVVQGAAKSDTRAIGGAAAEYARGKLAPQYGIAVDLALRKDAIGRPTPNASAEAKQKALDKGKEPYSWPEYAIGHGPIPLAGAVREVYDVMREKGTDDKVVKAVVRFLETLPIEATGVRVGRTPAGKPESTKGSSLMKGHRGSGSPSRSLSRKVRVKL